MSSPDGFASSAQGSAFDSAISPNLRHACEASSEPDVAHCLVLIDMRTAGGVRPDVAGWGPPDLQSAYNLPSSTAGGGQTIAIVDAYDNPNAEADVGVYRSNFGLPSCTTANGCFAKLNQKGKPGPYPAPNAGWAVEESLDVDMVSAICPNCHIILMEANTSSFKNLGTSVGTAITLGANVVSNSYIGYGAQGTKAAKYYDHPGTILTAGGGDGGYGIGEPAGFPTVVSVGGTVLSKTGSGRGWNEVVWSSSGSGCEHKLAKPSWQKDQGCKGRTMNDVSAVAQGVAVYDTYQQNGWFTVGGTSVGTPLIASVYGLAGNANTLNAGESLYAQGASLYDVTTGRDGTCAPLYWCTARAGYDGPTGNGTPNGVSAF
jgi:subtilase family serine protease